MSTLADCDTDKSIDAARKLACRLYDQKGKLKEDHVDLNKLRVRLATLRDACFKQTNKIMKKKANLPVDSDLDVVGGLSN